MESRLQKRMKLLRKLRILRTRLTNSRSLKMKKTSIVTDAFFHIYKLKLKLEAIKREYLYLLQHIPEVKVEKVGKNFVVKVTCKKGKDALVSILESFEETGLNVVQARVSSRAFLCVEAIVEAQDQGIGARDITEAVQKALGTPAGEGIENTKIP
ncbi:transcription factor MTB1-like [Diospyros lotus]|uniref:transcription factor MTB1-like n=1 Tax=Diospyros lotus TaxID=55363 RepID=UPI00224ECA68|nr:transcription factor MTB1-like [Diospyros lotus]XP_052202831.1 transcription factor MTB1-like [Diospyros lotus]